MHLCFTSDVIQIFYFFLDPTSFSFFNSHHSDSEFISLFSTGFSIAEKRKNEYGKRKEFKIRFFFPFSFQRLLLFVIICVTHSYMRVMTLSYMHDVTHSYTGHMTHSYMQRHDACIYAQHEPCCPFFNICYVVLFSTFVLICSYLYRHPTSTTCKS